MDVKPVLLDFTGADLKREDLSHQILQKFTRVKVNPNIVTCSQKAIKRRFVSGFHR